MTMELCSWIVLKVYRNKLTNEIQIINQTTRGNFNKELNVDRPLFSDLKIKKELDEAGDSYFSYESFLVYKNSRYVSKYLNIDDDGIRSNGTEAIQKNNISENKKKEIWLLGSSAIFGVTNADHETVAAYIEKDLNKSNKNYSFEVKNLGVVAYNSLQDFLNLRIRMITQKPDMIIVINGINDYYQSWLTKKIEHEMLLITGMNSSSILEYYWNFHENKKIMSWANLEILFRDLFSNSLHLIKLSKKWFKLKTLESDIDTWKKNYREEVERSKIAAKENIPLGIRFYIENMRTIANISKQKEVEVLFIQQPLLYSTKKTLLAHEISEYIHGRISYFALTEDELNKIQYIPTPNMSQRFYWDFDDFVNGYDKQKKALETLTTNLNVNYHDVMLDIDKTENIPVFSSPVHYTYRGAKIIADSIVPVVNKILIQ